MVFGRIQHGQIELSTPIPASWEGQTVQVEPCAVEEALPDLAQRLAALHALGPVEYDPGEREQIEQRLQAANELSREHMRRLADDLP
jgi:hypothetical protein